MHRDSGLAHAAARTLFAAVFAIALGYAANAPAQSADAVTDDSAASAAPAEQPRRGRDRRRNDAGSREQPAVEATTAAETAAAPTHAVTTESSPLPVEPVEEDIVCKNIKLTGTKISRRICGTQEKWAAREKRTTDDAQEAMRQIRDRSSIVVTQPDNPLSPGGQ